MRSIDYHMHTRFSGDSEADPREHVIQAIKMGLDEICFTDHRDFDYPIDVFDLDVEGYYQTIMALKKEFADKIIHILDGKIQSIDLLDSDVKMDKKSVEETQEPELIQGDLEVKEENKEEK